MPKRKRKGKGASSRAAYNSSHRTLYPHNVPAKRVYKRRKVKRNNRKR